MPFKSPPSQFPSAMDLTLPRIQPERTRKNPKVRYTHVYNFLYNFISTQFPRADVPVSSLSLSLSFSITRYVRGAISYATLRRLKARFSADNAASHSPAVARH